MGRFVEELALRYRRPSVKRDRGWIARAGRRAPARRVLWCALAAGLAVGSGSAARGQEAGGGDRTKTVEPTGQPPASQPPVDALASYEHRLIREVRLEGLKDVNTRLVTNQVRAKAGNPLSLELVRDDIKRLNRLGRFKEINAKIEPLADQSVVLVYQFAEAKVVTDVQSVGNRQVTDQEIAAVLPPLAGTPVNEFELGTSATRIQDLYRKKGYYLAEVTVDKEELEKTGVVLFRIHERERVKVTDIRFRGNKALSADQIRPELRTKTAGLLETGPLDDDVLEQDVATVVNFYKDRGYLDVRADREVRPSPDAREAIVTFIIDEGPLYTLRSLRAELADGRGMPGGTAPKVFTVEQLAGLMFIKAGDAYSVDKLNKSVRAVQDAYGKLGYFDAKVSKAELRDPARPEVDLLLLITEGQAWKTGVVSIANNELTQQKVIRRLLDPLRPDRPLDAVVIREAKDRLDGSRLFEGAMGPGQPSSVKITVQPPPEPGDDHRDVLVEVKETNTGSLNFGVGVSSDSGLLGYIKLTQRNFDVFDMPDSFEELVSGRSFRGAGQTFDITLSPGTDLQNYSISLADPYLFESDYSGSVSGYYTTREYSQYEEDRVGGAVSVGRRFGDRWTGSLTWRAYEADLHDIDADAPTDVFEFEAPHTLMGIGIKLTRATYNRSLRPTKGTKVELAAEQVGLLGGDFDFTKLSGEYALLLPVYEDFLGRATTVTLRTQAAYIPQDKDEVPVYERYYLGGRSFRGFRFRTVSPKGIANDTGVKGDDPVGGTWLFFAGAELEQPLWQDILSGVVFVDSGTVTNQPGFDEYRVAVGFGLRVAVPQLGPVPLAFDFGFPIMMGENDDRRVFSFSIDLPY